MRGAAEGKLEDLFTGRPASLALFRVVRAAIDEIGPSTMRVTKTQVGFSTVRGFAWVWLPQLWTTRRAESSVTVAFGLDRREDDERIADAVEARPGRWTHHVVVDTAADVDAQLSAWLRQAYALSAVEQGRT